MLSGVVAALEWRQPGLAKAIQGSHILGGLVKGRKSLGLDWKEGVLQEGKMQVPRYAKKPFQWR